MIEGEERLNHSKIKTDKIKKKLANRPPPDKISNASIMATFKSLQVVFAFCKRAYNKICIF